MGEVLETIYLGFVGVVSLALCLGVMAYIIFSSNSRWRDFETMYPARNAGEPIARKLSGMVRISRPGFRWGHLSGDLKSHRHPPVWFGVYDDGLSLSIMPPFKYGCRDLFLPFARMSVEPATWDWVTDAYGLQMEGVDDLEIVVFPNVLEWAGEKNRVLQSKLDRAEAVRTQQASEAG